MFWGSKRSLMACMMRISGPGGPQIVGGAEFDAFGMFQHDHRSAMRAAMARTAGADKGDRLRRPIPSTARGESVRRPRGRESHTAGQSPTACRSGQQPRRAARGFPHRPRRRRTNATAVWAESSAINEYRQQRPLLAHSRRSCSHHPIHFRRGALEADIQVRRRCRRPHCGIVLHGRELAISSTATGRVSDGPARPAASPQRRDWSSAQAINAEASQSGRTMSVDLRDHAERAERAGHQPAHVIARGVFHHAAAAEKTACPCRRRP